MLGRVVVENGVKKIVPLTADCGSGNPCGAIITVYQRTVPNGYLPLGAQYDITQFPVLYSILGTDTIPTASALGLPTLTTGQYVIKATSGINENQADNVLSALSPVNAVTSSDMHAVTSNAVADKISSLDVSSVGGSGKYISAISETDGKINATATDLGNMVPVNSVTSGNMHSVTSNAVALIQNYKHLVRSYSSTYSANQTKTITQELENNKNYIILCRGSNAGYNFIGLYYKTNFNESIIELSKGGIEVSISGSTISIKNTSGFDNQAIFFNLFLLQ
jgi:hypothetical protein